MIKRNWRQYFEQTVEIDPIGPREFHRQYDEIIEALIKHIESSFGMVNHGKGEESDVR